MGHFRPALSRRNSSSAISMPAKLSPNRREKEASLPLYQPLPGRPFKFRAKRFLSFLLGTCALVLLTNQHNLSKPEHPPHQVHSNPAYLIEAEHGAVASENKICSDVGVEILKDGGNAVDSAVASTLCIGVVNMFSSGIGGGGFMTVRIPSGDGKSQVFNVDFRETAPALANSTMYIHDPLLAKYGGLAAGVPGELRGLEEAHRRWGNLPWAKVVQPSVKLASGWTVDRELAKRITWFPDMILRNPDWSAIFAPTGRFLQEGETIHRTNYSRTLAAIAEKGVQAFYSGPIAEAIIHKVRKTGGIITQQDFDDYSVNVMPALEGTYRDRRIYTTHAPTSGPVLIHMLNLMEHYDLDEGRTPVNVHRIVESMKFGFAARTRVCDPAFADGPTRVQIENIPTKEYADLISTNLTDDRTHTPDYYSPVYDIKTDHGTSHISTVDKEGMAVAVTSTVNLIFGSGVMDPVTGVILNDEMDDFATPGIPNAFGLYPSPYNYPEPGKRSLSSTAPTIIEHGNGTLHLVVGGSGGSRIFGSVFQVILNVDFGLDVSEAIEYGRLHDQLLPTYVDADNTYPSELIASLRQRGHNVTVADINRVAAAIQGVHIKDGRLFAASDSRKDGLAAGY